MEMRDLITCRLQSERDLEWKAKLKRLSSFSGGINFLQWAGLATKEILGEKLCVFKLIWASIGGRQ